MIEILLLLTILMVFLLYIQFYFEQLHTLRMYV